MKKTFLFITLIFVGTFEIAPVHAETFTETTTPSTTETTTPTTLTNETTLTTLPTTTTTLRMITTRGYYGQISEGIVRLNQNDFSGAMQSFKQAIEENPQGVEALYYIGVTHTRTGEFDEAEKRFKEALAQDPTFISAHFDLGVLYNQQKKDNQALQEFDFVQRIDPGRARVYYYQGLILRRMGKPKEAAEKMEKVATLDPGMAQEANAHAGSAYFEAGEMEPAQKMFQNLLTLNSEGEVAHVARNYLEQIDQRIKDQKRWDISLSTGLQHDDNVILKPTQIIPSSPMSIKESALRALFFLHSRYQWPRTLKWTGHVEYNFYQNFYKDDPLHPFNLQSHDVLIHGGRRFHTAEVLLESAWQSTTLGGERYLLRQHIGPRIVFQANKKNQTEFSYPFGSKKFGNIEPFYPNNTDRNVYTHVAQWTHTFFFSPKANLHVGYDFIREKAGSQPAQDDWTFRGHTFRVGGVLPLGNAITLAADTEYGVRRFTEHNQQPPGEKREDHEGRILLTLSKPITPNVDFSLQSLHQQNRSNIPLFEYRRNIYGGMVTVRF